MKYKKCEILLVSKNYKELKSWIKKYENETISFRDVDHTKIRQCIFIDGNEKIIDFRTNLTFVSKASKNNIYFLSNNIKANPIKFS